MPKRARTETTSNKAKIARAIAAKMNSRFPYSTYGRSYTQRGTPSNVSMYGPTFKGANAQQRVNRKSYGFIGRGGYWGNLAGSTLGKWAGNVSGIPYLDQLGGWAGSKLEDSIRGRGNYKMNTGSNIQHNQLINPKGPSSVMRSMGDETNDVMICHSEYLQDIIPTSAGFQTQYFQPINPGLATTFPWLSQIAQYFEEYEFIQLVFEYKSVVTEGNSTASGTIIMATQYNPTNPAFTSKNNMENYEHANSLKVTDHAMHGVECDNRKTGQATMEYIRTGPVQFNQDPKTYDLAVFQLATSGANITGGQQYGELWVHYKIKLSKTKVLSTNPNLQKMISAQVAGVTATGNNDNILNCRNNASYVSDLQLLNNLQTNPLYVTSLLSEEKNVAGPCNGGPVDPVYSGGLIDTYDFAQSNIYCINTTIPGNVFNVVYSNNNNLQTSGISFSAIVIPQQPASMNIEFTIFMQHLTTVVNAQQTVLFFNANSGIVLLNYTSTGATDATENSSIITRASFSVPANTVFVLGVRANSTAGSTQQSCGVRITQVSYSDFNTL